MPAQYSTGWNGPIIEPKRSAAAPRLAVALSGLHPAEVRLRGARAIIDQKEVSCCISCAISTCLEVLYPELDQLSPLFHYYENALRFRGRPPTIDEGMEADQGFASLGSAGVCVLSLHNGPFDESGVALQPSPAAIQDGASRAMPYLLDRYVSPYEPIELTLDAVNNMKRVLAGGRPILAAILLTVNYGAVRLIDPGPRNGQRHAVTVLGYSNTEACFIVQDSRGKQWAQGGQWWLPYSVVASPETILSQAFAVGYPS